jgi:hypothetical protein
MSESDNSSKILFYYDDFFGEIIEESLAITTEDSLIVSAVSKD